VQFYSKGQNSRMDEPIIISTESEKPIRKGPPARFAKYMNSKQKEDEKQAEVFPVPKEINSKSEGKEKRYFIIP
jgi:hypothetical protein